MKSYCYTPKSFTTYLFILTASIGIPTAYAEQIIITDGQPGHVIDGQSVDRIDIWNKGTGVDIKNTTANGSVTYINGPQGNIENTTINCTLSGCNGLIVQATQTVTTNVTGDGINISAMGDGLYVIGSSFVDLKNVTIISGKHGLNLNGSVASQNFANTTKIDGFDITAGKYGVYAMFGSQVELSNGSVTTTADQGVGVYLGGANYLGDSPLQTTVKMNNVTVHTNGNDAYGVYSAQMSGGSGKPNRGAISSWDHSNIITEGDGSSGIVGSYNWNTITLTNGSTVMTSGNNANGIESIGNATISLDNSQIKTQGNDSVGVLSYYSGNSYLTNNSYVETSGDNSHAAMVAYAGKMSLENSAIKATGTNAAGIYMQQGVSENNGKSDSATVNLNASSVVSEQSYGVVAEGGSLQLNVLDGSVLKGDAGLIDVIDYTGTDTPLWDQGITTVEMTVDGNSRVHGKVQTADSAIMNMALTNNSLWELDADSNLSNLNNDNSIIRFISNYDAQQSTNSFSTLTVNGDYTGNNGLLVINTQFDGDNSQTDKMIVNGDTSGNTYVQVNNIGGLGAQTIEGIEVITVNGNSAGNFEQSGRIVAGAYDYTLVRGSDANNANNWYLTSQLSNNSNVNVLRPEAGSYLANLVAANTMFNVRLADRQGETSYIDVITGVRKTTSMWLHSQYSHSQFGVANQLNVKNQWYVTLLGGDIATWSSNQQDNLHLGLMAGYGRSTNDVGPNQNGNRSSGNIDGYSFGLYGTWFQHDDTKLGAYFDSWMMWYNLDAQVNGENRQTENYDLDGITASLEGGYSFLIDQSDYYRLWLQPQGQLIWMGVDSNTHTDSYGTRVSGNGNNLQTRLGLRMMIDANKMSTETGGRIFLETNWLYNSSPFSIKMNSTEVSQSGVRNVAEFKGGFESNVNKQTNIWVNVGYQRGDHNYQNVGLSFGAQLRF